MGLVLLKMDNYNQAEASFKAAVFYSAGNDSPQLRCVYYNNLAVCFEATKDLRTALKYFKTAVRIYPEDELANSNVKRVSDKLKSDGISVN